MSEVTQEDISRCDDYLPVITYLSGYCCYAVHKRVKCEYCKDFLVDDSNDIKCLPQNQYIKGIDRGDLLYPNHAFFRSIIEIIKLEYLYNNFSPVSTVLIN